MYACMSSNGIYFPFGIIYFTFGIAFCLGDGNGGDWGANLGCAQGDRYFNVLESETASPPTL
jgi:hypothetical protein